MDRVQVRWWSRKLLGAAFPWLNMALSWLDVSRRRALQGERRAPLTSAELQYAVSLLYAARTQMDDLADSLIDAGAKDLVSMAREVVAELRIVTEILEDRGFAFP